MKWWFLGLLLLASCSPFGDADAPASADADSTDAPTAPTEATTTTSTTASSQANSSSTSTSAVVGPLWTMTGGLVVIPVCWESADGGVTQMKLQNTVQAEWMSETNLFFNGWLGCNVSPANAVRIVTQASGESHAEALGAAAAGLHVFIDVGAGDDAAATDLLHELGHVAGLGHQSYSASGANDRATCEHVISASGITNDLPAEAPDDRGVPDLHTSIMSRCRESNAGAHISPQDVLAIQRLYPSGTNDGTEGDNFDE